MIDRRQAMLQQTKRLLVVHFFYVIALLCSYFLAYELRFDFDVPDNFREQRNGNFLWVMGLKWLFLWQAGQFKSIMAYFRLHDALRLFVALALVGFCLLFMWYSLGGTKSSASLGYSHGLPAWILYDCSLSGEFEATLERSTL